MAQPNVAREPSMEEILASIRRIIESNEPEEAVAESEEQSAAAAMAADKSEGLTVSAPQVSEDVDDSENDDIQLTVDGTFDDVAPVEEETAPAIAEKPEAAKPSSLAEIAARVRAGAGDARPAAMDAERSSPVVTAQMKDLASGNMRAELPKAVASAEPEKAEASQSAEPAAKQGGGKIPAGTAVTTVSLKPQNIVSQTTETKVSRSFNDLVEALNAEPKRSLDELAEEMLRPMLREWLDDNLPQMVERLVREEIERVARGPRG